MLIDTEALDTLRPSIDQSQSVRLASCELEFGNPGIVSAGGLVTCSNSRTVEVHFSVDEIVIRCRSRVRICAVAHNFFDDREIIIMVMICDENWSQINVVIRIAGPVNNHWPEKSTWICVRLSISDQGGRNG